MVGIFLIGLVFCLIAMAAFYLRQSDDIQEIREDLSDVRYDLETQSDDLEMIRKDVNHLTRKGVNK